MTETCSLRAWDCLFGIVLALAKRLVQDSARIWRIDILWVMSRG